MADVLSRPDYKEGAKAQWAESARKYAVEALGTFFLAFTVGAATLSGSTYTPLAAGAVLMAMIYAGGHISGGHYNPAVTMAVLLRGRIDIGEAIAYWIAQFAAGVAASAVSHAIVNPSTVRALPLSGHAFTSAASAELLFTFALCWVVLNVATSREQTGNGFFGLAIGITVTAGAFAVGGISGGSFNPAVTLGAATSGIFAWSTLWIYFLVELGGGVLAGLAFRALNLDDK